MADQNTIILKDNLRKDDLKKQLTIETKKFEESFNKLEDDLKKQLTIATKEFEELFNKLKQDKFNLDLPKTKQSQAVKDLIIYHSDIVEPIKDIKKKVLNTFNSNDIVNSDIFEQIKIEQKKIQDLIDQKNSTKDIYARDIRQSFSFDGTRFSNAFNIITQLINKKNKLQEINNELKELNELSKQQISSLKENKLSNVKTLQLNATLKDIEQRISRLNNEINEKESHLNKTKNFLEKKYEDKKLLEIDTSQLQNEINELHNQWNMIALESQDLNTKLTQLHNSNLIIKTKDQFNSEFDKAFKEINTKIAELRSTKTNEYSTKEKINNLAIKSIDIQIFNLYKELSDIDVEIRKQKNNRIQNNQGQYNVHNKALDNLDTLDKLKLVVQDKMNSLREQRKKIIDEKPNWFSRAWHGIYDAFASSKKDEDILAKIYNTSTTLNQNMIDNTNTTLNKNMTKNFSPIIVETVLEETTDMENIKNGLNSNKQEIKNITDKISVLAVKKNNIDNLKQTYKNNNIDIDKVIKKNEATKNALTKDIELTRAQIKYYTMKKEEYKLNLLDKLSNKQIDNKDKSKNNSGQSR
ncbi:MAG: hypothetical protein U1E31_01485 [Rickettsiales bacterium]